MYALLLGGACRIDGYEAPPAGEGGDAAGASVVPAAAAQVAAARPAALAARETCPDPVPAFEAGAEIGRVCPDAAAARGLTVIDLSDDWVPAIFRDEPYGSAAPNPYRATYVALANNRLGRGPQWDRARADVYLELYGIVPSFARLAARLLDEPRAACHRLVDSSPLFAVERPIDVYLPPRGAFARMAVQSLDAHLVCDGLLPAAAGPRKRWRLQAALETWQRKHAIVTKGMLDAETRRALSEDEHELEFRALLRGLRARVVDAAGILEDGSARLERGTILGRRIDGDAVYLARYDAASDGAADIVSPSTEAAARALGWTDPERAASFFRARGTAATERLLVAVALPRRPDYYDRHMELRAEIDRGDVWYESPLKRGRIEHRPTLTVWARRADGTEIALIRWPTTIGGWKKEAVGRGDRVVLRYKNSDVGPRVWRDLVTAPAWIPPPDTPSRTMVRRADDGSWVADADLSGPGYASAYGLVALIHHAVVKRGERIVWEDNGIRTHGSVSYDSIQRGESHGCHRLFNQSAVELGGFLLAHRTHVSRGVDARPFVRIFRWKNHVVELPIPDRGYVYELTPPVPVEVLKGHIRGKVKRVPTRTLYVRQ